MQVTTSFENLINYTISLSFCLAKCFDTTNYPPCDTCGETSARSNPLYRAGLISEEYIEILRPPVNIKKKKPKKITKYTYAKVYDPASDSESESEHESVPIVNTVKPATKKTPAAKAKAKTMHINSSGDSEGNAILTKKKPIIL